MQEPTPSAQVNSDYVPPAPPERGDILSVDDPQGDAFLPYSPHDERIQSVPYDTEEAAAYSRELARRPDELAYPLAPAGEGPDLYLTYYVSEDDVYRERTTSLVVYWENEGDETAEDVIITQTLPVSATYVAHGSSSYVPDYVRGCPPFALDGHVAVWHLGAVQPGWYGWLMIDVELDPALSVGAVVSGQAIASVAPGETDTADNTALFNTVVLAPAPDVTLDTWLDRNVVYEGSEVTYRIYVHNSGVLPAVSVRVTDTLPLSVTHIGNSNYAYLPDYVPNPFTATVSGRSIVWDIGTLAPGWTAYLQIQTSLWPELTVGSVVTNEAVASAVAGEADTADNRMDSVNTVLSPSADLYTSKWQSGGTFQPGQNVTYGLYWANYGVLTATNVRLTDTLPLSVTFVSDWGSDYTPNYTSSITHATVSDNVLVWELGSVAPGWRGYRYVDAYVDPTLGLDTLLHNRVEISQTMLEIIASDNVAHHRVALGPDLAFSKWLDGNAIYPDYDAHYWLYWENYGELIAPNARVTDTLPTGMSLVSANSVYLCQSYGCTGWEPITPTVSGDTIVWEVGDVEPGWRGWIYLTTHIDAATPIGTAVVNSAAIDYEGRDGRWPSADIEHNVAESPRADVRVTKYLDYGSPYPGGEMTYGISVANEGVLTATDSRVTDTLPNGMAYLDDWNAPITSVVDGNTIVWDLGNVPANSSRTIYLQVRISDTITPGTVMTNAVAIRPAPDETDLNDNEDTYAFTVQTPRPDAYVYQYLSSGSFYPDSNVTYAIYVSNQGAVTATNVRLTDTLPISLTFVEEWGGPVAASVVGNEVVWELGDMSPGAYYYIYLRAHIHAAITPGTVVVNQATASISPDEVATTNNTVSRADTILVPTPDMRVNKYSWNNQAYPGATVTYEIYWRNEGSLTAPSVRLTDTLPLSLTYVSHSMESYTPGYTTTFGTVTVDGQTLVWELGDVEPGWYGYIYLSTQLSFDAVPETVITNTVSASSVGESNTANNSSSYPITVQTSHPDVYVSKYLSSGPFYPDSNVTYAIYVGNQGAVTATNVRLTDMLPISLTFVEEWGGPVAASAVGNEVVWELGDMSPGAYYYIYLRAHINAAITPGTVVVNQATASISPDEVATANNTASISGTILQPAPDMRVAKSQYDGAFYNGYYVTYRLYWTNEGQALVHDVVLTDTLPLSMTYDSHWGYSYTPTYTMAVPTATVQGNTVVWELGDVEPGWYGNLYLKVWIDAATPAGTYLVNQASLSIDPAESDVYDNDASYGGTVQMAAPDLWVNKYLYSGSLYAGYEATYRVRVSNQGVVTATSVWLTDTLPVSTTFVDEWGAPSEAIVDGNTVIWNMGDVAPGVYRYAYVRVLLDPALTPGTMITNEVEVSPALNELDLLDNRYSYPRQILTPLPDMRVAKSQYDGAFYNGYYVTYRLYWTNEGQALAHDVVLTDTLPLSMTYDSHWGYSYAPTYTTAVPTAAVQGDTVVWELGNVEPGWYGNLYLKVWIDGETPPGTDLVNQASLSIDPAESDVYDNDASYGGTVQMAAPELAISKYQYSSGFWPGQDTVYRISWANTGYNAGTSVSITDTLPAGLTYAGSWGADYDPDYHTYPLTPTVTGDTIVWQMGDISPQNSGYIYLTATLAADLTAGTPLTNYVSITTGLSETNLSDNTAYVVNTVDLPDPDLQISKYLYGSLARDSEVTYRLYYYNYGSQQPAWDTILTDTLPAGLSFLRAEWWPNLDQELAVPITPTTSGQTLTFDLGTVPGRYDSGYRGYILIRAHVSAAFSAGATVVNRARITTTYEIDPGDNVAQHSGTVVDPTYDLYVTTDLNSPYPVTGHPITYYVSLANRGNASIENVVLTQTLPISATFLAAEDSYGQAMPPDRIVTRIDGRQQLVWEVGTLDGYNGLYDDLVLYVSALLDADLVPGTPLLNEVEAWGDQVEIPNSYQNYASYLTNAQAPNYDLVLTKTFDENQNVTPGERVYFYITTRNMGNLEMHGAVMVDTLPAGLTYDYSSIYGWTIIADGQTITYTRDSLAPDYYESGYLYAIVSETVAAGELFTNTITISGAEPDDVPLNNQAAAMATADVVQHGLTLDKSAYDVADNYATGTRVTWRLRYQNTGNISEYGVIITDTLPSFTTYDSTYASSDSSGWTRTINGGTVTWHDNGTLSVGESGYLYISAIIDVGLAPGTVLTNSASATSYALTGIATTHAITSSGPLIDVSPSPLVMQDAFAGYSRDYELQVDNLGYGTLTVSDIRSSSPLLSVGSYSLMVGSRGSRLITATFAPTQTGAFTGTLTFLSSDYNTSVFVVTATALVTEAPSIVVTPSAIVDGLLPDQSVTRTLTLSNAGDSPLRFEVGNSAQPSLEEILDNLNQSYTAVNSLVPYRYDFTNGTSGYYIYDGGYDMYDSGNRLSTNLGSYLYYQDNTIVASSYLGATGRYFTRKYPGLFIMGADLDGVSEFRITGGLGADGAGSVEGTVLSMRYFGTTYYGFVKRVYGVSQPSVNHLIIVAGDDANHTFSTNTNYDDHTVYNLEGADRLYYLLYASRDGGVGTYIDDAETLAIMRTFLEAIEAEGLPDWVSVTPLTGTLAVSSSLPLDVVLDSSGLVTGTHTTTMMILSNDPVTPEVAVPITLHVAGDPLPVVIPTTPDFGISYVGYAYTQALAVANQGTADLQVYSISVDNPTLAVSPGSLEVPLGESHPLTLIYAPVAVGPLSATLSLSSNSSVSPVLEVPVIGQALMPPVIEVTPSALAVTATAGLSPTVPLTIVNAGASDLTWTMTRHGGFEDWLVDTVALAGSGSASLYAAFTADSFLDRFTFVDVGDGYTSATLDGYDMVVVGEGDAGISSTEADALYTFYQAGGPVILGMDDVDNLLAATRETLYEIFGVTNAQDGTFYPGLTSDHPIAEGVTSLSSVASDNDHFDANGAEWVVRGSDGYNYFLAYEDRARTVIMGEYLSSWYSTNPDLVRNALLWAGRGWLSVTPESGTIAAGASQILSVTLDATRLAAGIYTATIGVESNDPATSYLTIPVTLKVVGNQAIAVSPSVLNFDAAYVGYGNDLVLEVMNDGASPLVVSEAIGADPTLTLSESSFTVDPYGRHDLIVTYTPVDTTPLTASIVLTSNDPVSPVVTVPAYGSPIPAPDVATTPSSFNVEQDTGLVTTRTLWIENIGPGLLSFELETTNSIVTLDPLTGTLDGPGTVLVTVTFDTRTRQPGFYSGEIRVIGNDPDEPLLQLPVSLIVVLVTPEEPVDPDPGDGATGVNIASDLSWQRSPHATYYDVYLWKDGETKPSSPTAIVQQPYYWYRPYYNPPGDLETDTLYKWQVLAANQVGTALGAEWTFTTERLPDLEVVEVVPPAISYSSYPITVTWVVTNSGTGAASGWFDAVYISTSPVYDSGGTTYLGHLYQSETVSKGTAYSQKAIFTLPDDISGDYYLYVVADSYNYEREINETNNVGRSPSAFPVSLTPLPDAAQSTIIVTPTTVIADGTATAVVSATLRDRTGEAITNREIQLVVTGWENTVLPAVWAITDAAGRVSFRFASTYAEQKDVSLYDALTGVDLPAGSVLFVAGPLDPAVSSLSAYPTEVAADGYSSVWVTAHAYDTHGNPLQDAPVSFSITGSAVISSADETTDSIGRAVAVVVDDVAETVTVSATIAGVTLEDMPSITFRGVDLAVSKTANAPSNGGTSATYALSGHPITYTLTIANNGLLPANAVVVTDILPVAVTFVSQSASYPFNQAGEVLIWDVGTLNARETVVIEVVGQVAEDVTGTIVNELEASTSSAESDTSNNRASKTTIVEQPTAILRVSPIAPTLVVTPGHSADLVFTISNLGSAPMVGITVAEPPHIPWVAVNTGGLTDLAPGASAPATITANVAPDQLIGQYRDFIIVTEDGGDTGFVALTVDVMRPKRTLQVTVMNDQGTSISGAKITMIHQSPSVIVTEGITQTYNYSVQATTDGNGLLTFRDLPTGMYDYVLTAINHTYTAGVITVLEGSGVQAEILTMPAVSHLAVSPETPVIGVRQGDTAGQTIEILNLGAAPLSDVTITPPAGLTWVYLGTPAALPPIGVGESGRFTIFASPPVDQAIGTYQEYVTVTANDGQTAQVALTVEVTGEQTRDLEILAVDGAGNPVSPGRVVLTEQAFSIHSSGGVTTTYNQRYSALLDPDGTAAFPNLRPGDYNYVVTASGYELDSGTLTVVLGSGTQMASIVLTPAPFTYEWTVTPISQTYDITLTLTYDTHSARPGVVIPGHRWGFCWPDPQLIFDTFTVYNMSPITLTLTDVSIDVPGAMAQFAPYATELGPSSSIDIPVTAASDGSSYRQGSIDIEYSYVMVDEKFVTFTFNPSSLTTPWLGSGEIYSHTFLVEPGFYDPQVAYTLNVTQPTIFDWISLDVAQTGPMNWTTATDIPATLTVQPPVWLAEGVYTDSISIQVVGDDGTHRQGDLVLQVERTPDGFQVHTTFELGPIPYVIQTGSSSGIINAYERYCSATGGEDPPDPKPDYDWYWDEPNLIARPKPISGTVSPPLFPWIVYPPTYGYEHQQVRLEISQQIMLEGEGFEAGLDIENTSSYPLEVVSVDICLTDVITGDNRTDAFVITPTVPTALGEIAAGGSAQGEWLVLPDAIGVTSPEGERFNVVALIHYTWNGASYILETVPEEITVYPSPDLHVTYFLPPPNCTSTVFDMMTVITNTGAGPARNLRFTSSQPRITEDVSGLPIGFAIVETYINGTYRSPSLDLTLGDLKPGEVITVVWRIEVSVPGRFVEFTSDYRQSNYVGLGLPPLISELNTRFSQDYCGVAIGDFEGVIKAVYPPDHAIPSAVEQGGVVYRHFQLLDAPDGNPIPNALVEFSMGGTIETNADGYFAWAGAADEIGAVGYSYIVAPRSVTYNGETYQTAGRPMLTIRIGERHFSHSWGYGASMSVKAGISAGLVAYLERETASGLRLTLAETDVRQIDDDVVEIEETYSDKIGEGGGFGIGAGVGVGIMLEADAEVIGERYILGLSSTKVRFTEPYEPEQSLAQAIFLLDAVEDTTTVPIPDAPFLAKIEDELEEAAIIPDAYVAARQAGGGLEITPLKEHLRASVSLGIEPFSAKVIDLDLLEAQYTVLMLATFTDYPQRGELGLASEAEFDVDLSGLNLEPIAGYGEKFQADLGSTLRKTRLEVIVDRSTLALNRVELSLSNAAGTTTRIDIPREQLGSDGLSQALNVLRLLQIHQGQDAQPLEIGPTAVISELLTLLGPVNHVGYETTREIPSQIMYVDLSLGFKALATLELGSDFTVTTNRNLVTERGVFHEGKAYTTERYRDDLYVANPGKSWDELVESAMTGSWDYIAGAFRDTSAIFQQGITNLIEVTAEGADAVIQGGAWFQVPDDVELIILDDLTSAATMLKEPVATKAMALTTPLLLTEPVTVTAVGWSPSDEGYGSEFVIGGMYDFSPYNLVISPTATLVMTYTDAALGGIDESLLSAYRWNPEGNNWQPVTAQADLAQNTFTATVDRFGTYTLGYGGTPTEIQILSPSDGSTITDTLVVIEALVTNDGIGIDPASVEMRLDGEIVAAMLITNTGQLIYMPTEPIIGGTHVITVSAADVVGHQASAQATFRLVYTPASLTIDGPASASTSTDLTFTVTVNPLFVNRPVTYTWQATDLDTITSVSGPTDTQVLTWTLTGSKTITVTADNGYGFTSNTFCVTVVEPVKAGFIAAPTSGISPLTVVFTDTSTGPVTAWEWDFGNGDMSDQPYPVYTYTVVGAYTVTLTVTGSTNSDSAIAVITVEEPITGIVALSDSPTALGDSTAFTATVGAGTHVSYTWAFGDGVIGYGGTISHTYEAFGTYTAVVTASNSVSALTDTVPVLVDGVAPTSLITTPIVGQVISQSTITIEGSAEDDLVGVARVEVSVDGGGTWCTATGTTAWRYTWMVPSENDIEHLLLSRAVDAVGHVQVAGEGVTVTVDTQAPAIVILTPAANAWLTGTTAVISGTAVDPAGNVILAVSRVEVSTDGGATWHQASGTTTWSYEWTLPTENRVVHTLLARVVDSAGHTRSAPVLVTVDTVAPLVSAVSPADGATDVGGGASLVITFTEAIDPGSLELVITPDPGGWEFSWNTATTVITASHEAYTGGTLYTVTATARDLVGHSLDVPFSWSFTTVDDAADLTVAQRDDPDPVASNQHVIYTITVTNAGPADATSVVLTDTLPVAFTYISASFVGCSATGPEVVCLLGNLSAGQETGITITAKVGEPGTFTNRVQVTSDIRDSYLANNESAETTMVQYNTVYLPLVIRQ